MIKAAPMYKCQMHILAVLLILLFSSSCQKPTRNNQSYLNEHSAKYFYLIKDENGVKNKDGKVLLHLSNEDSLLIEPEKVCSLHLAPNWARKEFPKEVFSFPNLKYLWVAMRDFKRLPDKITQLKQLEHLDLQHSGIRQLPENIGELESLKRIILLFSDIENLPESICDLPDLERIHLGATKIGELPPCLNKLESLKEFILFYEDGTEFPDELQWQVDQLQRDLTHCKFFIKNRKIE